MVWHSGRRDAVLFCARPTAFDERMHGSQPTCPCTRSQGATYLLFASYGSSCHTFTTRDVENRCASLVFQTISQPTPLHSSTVLIMCRRFEPTTGDLRSPTPVLVPRVYAALSPRPELPSLAERRTSTITTTPTSSTTAPPTIPGGGSTCKLYAP